MHTIPTHTPPHTSHGFVLLAHSELGGRPDALQVVGDGNYVYVAHRISGGFSVLDVTDPSDPVVAAHVPCPEGTKTLHLQVANGLLLLACQLATSAATDYRGHVAAGTHWPRNPDIGVHVFDISEPHSPRHVGHLGFDGLGVHRIFWDGGLLATASATQSGDTDFSMFVIDVCQPSTPYVVSHWAPGPVGTFDGHRRGLHHAILWKGNAFGSWRDDGVQIVSLTDPSNPRYVAGLTAAAWGGGTTHTTMPVRGGTTLLVVDESMTGEGLDLSRRIWMLGMNLDGGSAELSPRIPLPAPSDDDYGRQPGRCAPHNLHEPSPGGWADDSIVFATYQNAGLRAYGISDPSTPCEVGFLAPAPQAGGDQDAMGSGVRSVDFADVFVNPDGVAFVTDLNGGLWVAEFTG